MLFDLGQRMALDRVLCYAERGLFGGKYRDLLRSMLEQAQTVIVPEQLQVTLTGARWEAEAGGEVHPLNPFAPMVESCFAVHDKRSVAVVGQIDAQGTILFIECCPMSEVRLIKESKTSGVTTRTEEIALGPVNERMDPDAEPHYLNFGLVSLNASLGNRIKLFEVKSVSKKAGVIDDLTNRLHEETDRRVLRNVMLALARAHSLSAPWKNSLAVRMTPRRIQRNHLKSGMLLRTAERPRFTLLTFEEVESLPGYPQLGPRAGYTVGRKQVTYKHPRFTKARGETRWRKGYMVLARSWSSDTAEYEVVTPPPACDEPLPSEAQG